MSKNIEKVLQELKERRDNLDIAIRILQSEVKETRPAKRRGRPRKKAAAKEG
ncbi:MAG: hypothetical protein HS130_10660 [Deltaproteobacteria bacterium]|nr:hypothetical protein [Deltaproteobacteria bacterium]MCL4872558.1 hypothetical protein [bacterium]